MDRKTMGAAMNWRKFIKRVETMLAACRAISRWENPVATPKAIASRMYTYDFIGNDDKEKRRKKKEK
jgi:hypothetical protein